MRPVSIPHAIMQHYQPGNALEQNISSLNASIRSKYSSSPEISIVIPAYNEETTILQTLSSLAANTTNRTMEIVVVNNNSSDRTAELATAAGARCILETKQGITPARNAGLAAARGKYILNADADTIYPPDWIEEMVKPLTDSKKVAMVFGRFAFIPVGSTTRRTYIWYEYFAELTRWINKTFREEAVNVYGFNSGFRKADGLLVDGFTHPPGTNEDGWLALKLRDRGFGKIHCVKQPGAMVWTTDRRIQIDGGLWKATVKRMKRMLS
jgi:glycosyltransferase involved in cell wall biosynthesis